MLASGSSSEVEDLSFDPKVRGSSPTTAVGNGGKSLEGIKYDEGETWPGW
jgi:hypothetical protein